MDRLQEFAQDVWIVEGPLARDMGLLFTTRMAIVKLSDGSIWVDSPVPASFELLCRITALGPIQHLVAATPRHVWRLAAWHTLFPDARLWACRKTPLTLQNGRLPFAGILEDASPQAWADDFDQFVFKGNPFLSEVLFFHRQTHTLILDDIIQSNAALDGHPFRNALFKLEGALSPQSGVGLEMKLTFTNRKLARQSLEKVLSWDFDKLIIAHGDCIEHDAKQSVRQAFQWLSS